MIAIVAIPLLLWCICLVLGITFRNLSGKSSDRHLFVTGLIVFFASFYLFATVLINGTDLDFLHQLLSGKGQPRLQDSLQRGQFHNRGCYFLPFPEITTQTSSRFLWL